MRRRGFLVLGASLSAGPALARTAPLPEGFASPEAGFAAFAEGVKTLDDRRLLAILGEGGRQLIWSGDPAGDRLARDKFSTEYAAKADILRPAPDRAVLQIGQDGWQLPIPMTERAGTWRFDTAAGAQMLIDRRIGGNELAAIEVLRAIAAAEREYLAGEGTTGGFPAYARRLLSSPGKRDGLYWPTAEGAPESPLGPLVAEATAGGYRRGRGPQPYHGYLFRILEGQGAHATGGALSYVVRGRMIGGFAALASPAQWGSTGLASYLISHHGEVWQSNLGPRTAVRAAAIDRFDPGPAWTKLAG